MTDPRIKRLTMTVLLGFAIMLIFAIGVSAILVTRLKKEIALLEAHEVAMATGGLQPTDAHSIPNISTDIKTLRWTTYVSIASAFLILFSTAVYVRYQGVGRRREFEPVLRESEGMNSSITLKKEGRAAGYAELQSDLLGDLGRNQLIQFTIVSFVIMLILAVGISALISVRLNHDIELLRAHGTAMMEGTLQSDDPHSIPKILEDVRNLRATVFVAVGSAYVVLYGSLVSIVWRGVTERRQLESRLRRALTQMEKLAMTDSLTGLLNRRAIRERAEAELDRVEREASDLSLILLDLDHFKTINDQYGHKIGDQALRLLAKALIESKRTYDWLGRWGGDEFLLMLPGTGLSEAIAVADRLQMRVNCMILEPHGGKALHLPVSLGISSTSDLNGDAATLDMLLLHADKALYHAKSEGRNRASKFANGEPIGIAESPARSIGSPFVGEQNSG